MSAFGRAADWMPDSSALIVRQVVPGRGAAPAAPMARQAEFLAGLGALILASTAGLSPWLMGLPFGLGQLLVALCLYLAGRNHG